MENEEVDGLKKETLENVIDWLLGRQDDNGIAEYFKL